LYHKLVLTAYFFVSTFVRDCFSYLILEAAPHYTGAVLLSFSEMHVCGMFNF